MPVTTLLRVVAAWLAEIRISEPIETKLRTRRFLTGDQVRRSVMPDTYIRATWDLHPVHGRRLLVTATPDDGPLIKLVLQPVDEAEGTWRLRTVLFTLRE